jgi:hypothetical protein
LGYNIEEGKVEEDEYFYKRMSGIMNLYFTILINPDYKNGMKEAWCWISDTLNLEPKMNITAEMLTIFFKCCGYQLQKVYSNQFKKLITLCRKHTVQTLQFNKSSDVDHARLGRLNLILGDYIKNGYFPEWKK